MTSLSGLAPPARRDTHPQELLRVLIVENNVHPRTSLGSGLRNHGHVVTEAADAEAAIDILQSAIPIDVVVTDTNFPVGRDGFFLAGWICERHPAVAIAVTSRTVGFEIAHARLADGAAFVEKPCCVDDLVLLLKELVRDRRA